jgi:RimJ/RimL family protein N-acetyltransferase
VRYVHVGAVFVPAYTGSGRAAHAVALFVAYLFHTLPLAKVYLEIPGYNRPQVRSGEDSFFRVKGVLRDHVFCAGRCWDQYLCYLCAAHRDLVDAVLDDQGAI